MSRTTECVDVLVRVRSCRVRDASKRTGHPRLHLRASLEVVEGPAAVFLHAEGGAVEVHAPVAALDGKADVPLTVGRTLRMRVRLDADNPPYVTVVGAIGRGGAGTP